MKEPSIVLESIPGQYGLALASGAIIQVSAHMLIQTADHYIFLVNATVTENGVSQQGRFEVARLTRQGMVNLLIGGSGQQLTAADVDLLKAAAGAETADPVDVSIESLGRRFRERFDANVAQKQQGHPVESRYFNYERVVRKASGGSV